MMKVGKICLRTQRKTLKGGKHANIKVDLRTQSNMENKRADLGHWLSQHNGVAAITADQLSDKIIGDNTDEVNHSASVLAISHKI